MAFSPGKPISSQGPIVAAPLELQIARLPPPPPPPQPFFLSNVHPGGMKTSPGNPLAPVCTSATFLLFPLPPLNSPFFGIVFEFFVVSGMLNLDYPPSSVVFFLPFINIITLPFF